MLRFLGQFQADFQLKSGWIEPLLVGGYAPFSPYDYFCSDFILFFISNQELYGLPHFYSFILCKYTLLTTTKLVLFLFLVNSYLLPNKKVFLAVLARIMQLDRTKNYVLLGEKRFAKKLQPIYYSYGHLYRLYVN